MDDEKALPHVVRLTDGNVVELEYHKYHPSPSTLMRDYAQRGYPDRYVILAESTDWDPDAGIYMSLLLRPSIFPSQAIFVGPAAAAASALALREHTTSSIGIGWISDVYCNQRYIGGVNVEGKLDSFTSYEYMILNFSLRLDAASFPPRLTDMVRKVFESENASIPMIIAKNVLNKFFAFYPSVKSPQNMMNVYSNLFALRGERVKYAQEGTVKTCKVLGVDSATCALIVEDRDGKVTNITTPKSVTIPKRLKNKKKT